MSVQAPDRLEELAAPQPGIAEPKPPEIEAAGPEPINAALTSLSVLLSTAAAGWMAAGVFPGVFPRVVALAGAVLGVGIVAGSLRTSRPSLVQYLALPLSVVAGAILVVPDATGGTANLPGLVAEAVRTGGVAQPPVPFDPGWRFLLLVLVSFVGSAAASLSTGLNRPRVGIAVPIPLLVAAALIQPPEATVVSTVVSLVLLVAALAVSYGVELAREGSTSGGFEIRRLGRGVGALVVLVAVMAAVSRAGFLFPTPDRDQVIPPARPEVQPPQADRVLFTVESERPGPWRLGVLDVYQQDAWFLPPYDTTRFQEIPADGSLPPAPDDREDTPIGQVVPEERETNEVRFRVADIEGHVLPTIADPVAVVRRGDFPVSFDPRTQMLRLRQSRASAGMTYTVRSPVPPTGEQLAAAPAPPPDFAPFLEAPPPPSEVRQLLTEAPEENLWERLQFVRDRFYAEVVAAGAGEPVDVPPERVEEMLLGGEGTPYEITAAEALLARWAGVPSRVGYGFYAGNKEEAGETRWEVRPRHGATWLEAYFDGHGWVPVIGKPPRAKASTSDRDQQEDPDIRPTDELALVVYVPVRLQSVRLLYMLVRYYVMAAVPLLLAALLAYALLPYPVKLARSFRRRRWAEGRGALEQVIVSYAELRDACLDLNIGDHVLSPLEFCAVIDPDAEHAELGWLVTRALWGDLRRDLRLTDAEAATDMARSVTRRVRVAQPALTRLLAIGSRASLRDPYARDVPNLWPSWARPGAMRRRVRSVIGVRRLRRLLPVGAGVLLMVLLASCGRGAPTATGRSSLPEPFVPQELAGYSFARETEAESAFTRAGGDALVEPDGRVYTVRQGADILGSLQAAVFKRELRTRDEETRREALSAIRESIGSGQFEPKRIAGFTIEEMRLPEQRILLWMPPDAGYYQLFVARQGFQEAERVFAGLLAFQQGGDLDIASEAAADFVDPRRGAPQ